MYIRKIKNPFWKR